MSGSKSVNSIVLIRFVSFRFVKEYKMDAGDVKEILDIAAREAQAALDKTNSKVEEYNKMVCDDYCCSVFDFDRMLKIVCFVFILSACFFLC